MGLLGLCNITVNRLWFPRKSPVLCARYWKHRLCMCADTSWKEVSSQHTSITECTHWNPEQLYTSQSS